MVWMLALLAYVRERLATPVNDQVVVFASTPRSLGNVVAVSPGPAQN
jgi:hypothetical protein